MSVIGNKKLTCTKNCTLSEAEADSVQSDLERTRLLAMTSQNENVEVRKANFFT